MGQTAPARRYGRVFDQVAAEYERSRPTYPDELVDQACALAGVGRGDRVLEVGCGSGQLTRSLLARDLSVTALEPGQHLISLAGASWNTAGEVEFVNARFEDARLPSGAYRAVFSASAFHWIDPEVSWEKAARVLAPGGTLALIQYCGLRAGDGLDDQQALLSALARIAPEIAAGWPAYRDLPAIAAGAGAAPGERLGGVGVGREPRRGAGPRRDSVLRRAERECADPSSSKPPTSSTASCARRPSTSGCHRISAMRSKASTWRCMSGSGGRSGRALWRCSSRRGVACSSARVRLQAPHKGRSVPSMDHLAIPVSDQARSRRFYETYFGFGARRAKIYDDGVLMLYDATGFALALGPSSEPVDRPSWMHFGVGLPSREAVLALRDRFVADAIELDEEWDEPDYVSVKCRDPDGYIVEASWEPDE